MQIKKNNNKIPFLPVLLLGPPHPAAVTDGPHRAAAVQPDRAEQHRTGRGGGAGDLLHSRRLPDPAGRHPHRTGAADYDAATGVSYVEHRWRWRPRRQGG